MRVVDFLPLFSSLLCHMNIVIANSNASLSVIKVVLILLMRTFLRRKNFLELLVSILQMVLEFLENCSFGRG